jgi:hypothetical protein
MVLVLGLSPKGLILFRDSIFQINTLYNPYLGRQCGTSQSPPLAHAPPYQIGLWPMGYGFDTICNDLRKRFSHICAITPKELVNMELP